MKTIRPLLAVWLGKLAGLGSRLFGRGRGAVISGAAARYVMPGILPLLSGMVRKKIFVVTGTNGKTTVTRLLCEALEREGMRVVCNRTGANLLNGVVSAFVDAAGKNGKLEADYACIEVDEMASVEIFPLLKPDMIVLTNVFRDQLDRALEVDRICERLKEAASSVKGAKLVYNGDDCLLERIALGCENPRAAYGIDEAFCEESLRTESREGKFCGFCGSRLVYKRIHYGQLGDYRCSGCGFKRPELKYQASGIKSLESWYFFRLNGQPFFSKTRSPYNVYNTLAVYSALKEAGVPTEQFGRTAAAFDYGNDREQVFCIGRTRVQLHLAKNPVGFQQKLSLLLLEEGPKDLVIQINDQVQDGRDVSWLWDVDFERLSGAGVEKLVVTGSRRYDMELRLKYENIPCRVSDNLLKTLRELLGTGCGNLYVIVNYSGLSRTGRLLRRLQKRGKGEEQK